MIRTISCHINSLSWAPNLLCTQSTVLSFCISTPLPVALSLASELVIPIPLGLGMDFFEFSSFFFSFSLLDLFSFCCLSFSFDFPKSLPLVIYNTGGSTSSISSVSNLFFCCKYFHLVLSLSIVSFLILCILNYVTPIIPLIHILSPLHPFLFGKICDRLSQNFTTCKNFSGSSCSTNYFLITPLNFTSILKPSM